MISVVIPTLEEENYLPLLLDDLKRQTCRPLEIIVVDAGSKDKTVQVAKQQGACVLLTRVKSAACQRNLGADHAKGSLLVFIDADMRLGSRQVLQEVKGALKNHVGATATSRVLVGERCWKDILLFEPVNLCARMFPQWVGRGGFMAVRSDIFRKIRGFDERRAVSEDIELFRRVASMGPVVCLQNEVCESGRRYHIQGHGRTVWRWVSNAVVAAWTGRSKDPLWEAVR